jgi:hypothetical protein
VPPPVAATTACEAVVAVAAVPGGSLQASSGASSKPGHVGLLSLEGERRASASVEPAESEAGAAVALGGGGVRQVVPVGGWQIHEAYAVNGLRAANKPLQMVGSS